MIELQRLNARLGGHAVWGSIEGEIALQDDLQYALEETKNTAVTETMKQVNSMIQGNPDLVTPIIEGSWTVYKLNGEQVIPTPSFPIEKGYQAKYTGKWKWDYEDGKEVPARTDGSWGTHLVDVGTFSSEYVSDFVSSNTTVSQTVYAKRTGLMVEGDSIVPATGEEARTASTSITFSDRIYFGLSEAKEPTEEAIKALDSKLGGKQQSINNISATTTQYFYFAYPKSLGKLKTIIFDGVLPVLGAFHLVESVSITNDAGLKIPMYVYVSNNPGAFTNNYLKFE